MKTDELGNFILGNKSSEENSTAEEDEGTHQGYSMKGANSSSLTGRADLTGFPSNRKLKRVRYQTLNKRKANVYL